MLLSDEAMLEAWLSQFGLGDAREASTLALPLLISGGGPGSRGSAWGWLGQF